MRITIAALFAAAFGIVTPAPGDEKKAEAKGTLMLDGKNYNLANALAYETTMFDKKWTVIYLSEKPLDTSKLKASFKKKGTDEDFFAVAPHVKLMFDDQGKLFQLALYAAGSNVILQGDPNIKAEATLRDGAAKGMAKTIKPDKDYTFEVTFDVKLIKP